MQDDRQVDAAKSPAQKPSLETDIIIGWRLARDLSLEWWDKADARVLGEQPDHVLEPIAKDAVAMHTAIIAQSGSGKSFFLGRYIEEVLLRTRARVTVFDPNADFRLIHRVNQKIWPVLGEDGNAPKEWCTRGPKRSPLTHEGSAAEFEDAWRTINKVVIGQSEPHDADSSIRNAVFHWSSLNANVLLVGERDLSDPSGFIALHEYVQAGETLWDTLVIEAEAKGVGPRSAIDWVERLKPNAGKNDEAAIDEIATIKSRVKFASTKDSDRQRLINDLENEFKRRYSHAADVADSVRERYTKKYRMLSQRRRLATSHSDMRAKLGLDSTVDVRVLDLPSFADLEDRDLTVLLMLDGIWREAKASWEEAIRKPSKAAARVPHLIVMDEAHNFVPAERPDSPVKAEIRERIKTIAGEGRKYGLFVVLVTQRPDKVDAQTLGECGNQAIMLMRSLSVLKSCRKLLGVELGTEESNAIRRHFSSGFVRLSGKWSPTPRIVFAAARRTIPGGADLSDDWMRPRSVIGAGTTISTAQAVDERRISESSPSVHLNNPSIEGPASKLRSGKSASGITQTGLVAKQPTALSRSRKPKHGL